MFALTSDADGAAEKVTLQRQSERVRKREREMRRRESREGRR